MGGAAIRGDGTIAELAAYVRYFNEERPHQRLDNLTPDGVYYRRNLLTKAA